MDIRTVTVKLGEKEFIITEAGWKKATAWKRGLIEDVKPMYEQVAGAADIKFESAEDLVGLWPLIQTVLVDGMDALFEHLLAYSPVLKKERDYIEENATEAQVFAAFKEVIGLADPFGLVAQFNRKIGLKAMQTTTSSPAPSGE